MDMNQPIFPAPAGYIVDILHPQRSDEAANIWVGTVGMIISSLFMGIRLYVTVQKGGPRVPLRIQGIYTVTLYTKIKLAKNFTADDGMYHSVIISS
jgi:hypothetical protein